MFKFSLRSFGAFTIFGNLIHVVSRKRLIVERNGAKFRPQGQEFSVYGLLLKIQGHSDVEVLYLIIRLQNLSDLNFDLSRSYKVKCDYVIGH